MLFYHDRTIAAIGRGFVKHLAAQSNNAFLAALVTKDEADEALLEIGVLSGNFFINALNPAVSDKEKIHKGFLDGIATKLLSYLTSLPDATVLLAQLHKINSTESEKIASIKKLIITEVDHAWKTLSPVREALKSRKINQDGLTILLDTSLKNLCSWFKSDEHAILFIANTLSSSFGSVPIEKTELKDTLKTIRDLIEDLTIIDKKQIIDTKDLNKFISGTTITLPHLSTLTEDALKNLQQELSNEKITHVAFNNLFEELNNVDIEKLASLLPYLQELDFSQLEIFSNPASLAALTAIFSKIKNIPLRSLNLSNFLDFPADTDIINSHFQKVKNNFLNILGELKKIESLNLKSCALTDKNCQHLATNFNGKNKLQKLFLGHNDITDKGLYYINKLILPTNLNILDLQDNFLFYIDNKLFYNSQYLPNTFSILKEKNTFKFLDLSYPQNYTGKSSQSDDEDEENEIRFSPAYLKSLCDFISRSSIEMFHLKLAHDFSISLLETDSKQIFEALSKNPNIRKIDLTGTILNETETPGLLRLLKCHSNIVELVFDAILTSEETYKEIQLQLKINKIFADLPTLIPASIKGEFYPDFHERLAELSPETVRSIFLEMFTLCTDNSESFATCDPYLLFDMTTLYCGLYEAAGQKSALKPKNRAVFLEKLLQAAEKNEGAKFSLLLIYHIKQNDLTQKKYHFSEVDLRKIYVQAMESHNNDHASAWTYLILAFFSYYGYGTIVNKEAAIGHCTQLIDAENHAIANFLRSIFTNSLADEKTAVAMWLPIACIQTKSLYLKDRICQAFRLKQCSNGDILHTNTQIQPQQPNSSTKVTLLSQPLENLFATKEFITIFGHYPENLGQATEQKINFYLNRLKHIAINSQDRDQKYIDKSIKILNEVMRSIQENTLPELEKKIQESKITLEVLIKVRQKNLEKETTATQQSTIKSVTTVKPNNMITPATPVKKKKVLRAKTMPLPKEKQSSKNTTPEKQLELQRKLECIRERAQYNDDRLRLATLKYNRVFDDLKIALVPQKSLHSFYLLWLNLVRCVHVLADIESNIMVGKQKYFWRLRNKLLHHPWLFSIEELQHCGEFINKNFQHNIHNAEKLIKERLDIYQGDSKYRNFFTPPTNILQYLAKNENIEVTTLKKIAAQQCDDLKMLAALAINNKNFPQNTDLQTSINGCITFLLETARVLFKKAALNRADYIIINKNFNDLRKTAAHRFSSQSLHYNNPELSHANIMAFVICEPNHLLEICQDITDQKIKLPDFNNTVASHYSPAFFRAPNAENDPPPNENVISANSTQKAANHDSYKELKADTMQK